MPDTVLGIGNMMTVKQSFYTHRAYILVKKKMSDLNIYNVISNDEGGIKSDYVCWSASY